MIDSLFLFFNGTATTEIYTYRHTLALHDALPIFPLPGPSFSHPRPLESLGALGAHMFVEPRAKRFDKGFVFARGNEAEIHARELVSARSCTDRKSTRLNSSH